MFLPCRPCCGDAGCGVADGKPRTDPATEGHWVPSGAWATGVTWTFSSTPSATDDGSWYFYGSSATSKVGGGASTDEQRDWGNICNWYSSKTTTPSSSASITTVLDKRATKLPTSNAIVHVYSPVYTTSIGVASVRNVYFWFGGLGANSEVSTSAAAYDSSFGTVFLGGSFFSPTTSIINGGATFVNSTNTGTVNDGAEFYGSSSGRGNGSTGTVNGGAEFYQFAQNAGTVNGGAAFSDSSLNNYIINGGGEFYDSSRNFTASIVNGGANFFDSSRNLGSVYDGTTFDNLSRNDGTVYDGAVFNDSSLNFATVNSGATFNNSSFNTLYGTVNGGATFNDSACSNRTVGSFASCPGVGKRIFVAHPTDLPTCNGTAPAGCDNAADTCGCG